jgi:hypothetical protein
MSVVTLPSFNNKDKDNSPIRKAPEALFSPSLLLAEIYIYQ